MSASDTLLYRENTASVLWPEISRAVFCRTPRRTMFRTADRRRSRGTRGREHPPHRITVSKFRENLSRAPRWRELIKKSSACFSRAIPRRGEIWVAKLGQEEGATKHWVVIVSLEGRNVSGKINSILVVPFASSGIDALTSFSLTRGECGLPEETSWLKGHFATTIRKTQLVERLPRSLSNDRMRQLTAAIRRALDPEAPIEQQAVQP